MGTASKQALERFGAVTASYLNDPKFSDFTIVCEGQEFKVHRCIISTHSEFFERCCSNDFKEGQTGRVDLKEDLPEVVERMVSYFYSFDYDDEVKTNPVPEIKSGRPANRTQMNIWVYALAEKYDISLLKQLAIEKIRLHTSIDDPEQMVGAAWAIFGLAQLPPWDTELKELFCTMWMLGGQELTAQIPDVRMVDLCASVPEFTAMFMSKLPTWRNARYNTLLECSNCGRKLSSEDTKSAALTPGLLCQYCVNRGTEFPVVLMVPVTRRIPTPVAKWEEEDIEALFD